MSVEPWSIERSSAPPNDARVVIRRLVDDEGRRWTCRMVAALLTPDGTAPVRQVVVCTPDDGSPPVHVRIAGDWSNWSAPMLLDAIASAPPGRDD